MAEKWRRYETLMIFDPELGTEATEELIQRSREFVGQEAGRTLKTERWGIRDLAFELKGRRKGYYLLLEYAGLPRVATELDRRLNLIDTVLKFQTIKLEEGIDPESLPEETVEEAPAAAEPQGAAEGVEPKEEESSDEEEPETRAREVEGDEAETAEEGTKT